MSETHQNWIDGAWVPSRSGGEADRYDPAHPDRVVSRAVLSTRDDVAAAVASAARSFEDWRRTSPEDRAEVLLRAASGLDASSEDLARRLVQEAGHTRNEAREEVEVSIAAVRRAAGAVGRFAGSARSLGDDLLGVSVRVPRGVVAAITSVDEPLAVMARKAAYALVAGNTLVMKPSSKTPGVASSFVRSLADAGLPSGVLNLLHGSGGDAGEPLLSAHPDVSLVSFAGSPGAGRSIAGRCAESLRPVSIEAGSNNAALVLEDADLDLAIDGVRQGAFRRAGQGRRALHRAIVHRRVLDAFLSRLTESALAVTLGPGNDPGSEMGPLADEPRLLRIASAVEAARRSGAVVVCGGSRPEDPALARGWFYPPTVLTHLDFTTSLVQDDVAGPVVSLLPVDSFEEALHVLNDSPYGVSAAVFTQDVRRALHSCQELEVGEIAVNPARWPRHAPRPAEGGTGSSDGGPEAASAPLDIFTAWRALYLDSSRRPGTAAPAAADSEGV